MVENVKIDELAVICFFFFAFWKNRQKNGTDVSAVPSLQGRYEIHAKENNIIIRDTEPEDAGLYTCSIPGASADIEVIGKLSAI